MMHIKCRICNKNSIHELCEENIKTRFNEQYSIFECTSCNFMTVHPLPDTKTLEKYYFHDYWMPSKSSELMEKLFALRMRGVLKYFNKKLGQGSLILDWGSGNGDLVKLLNRNGFNAIGIDKYCKNEDGKKIFACEIDELDLTPESLDGITCFHVLEHLHDPVEEVRKTLPYLKKDGILMIELPNIASWGFSVFKKRWQPLQIPTHLNHFSVKSILGMIDKIGGIEVDKIFYFSSRSSTAALVLSCFPRFAPKFVRVLNEGRYPFMKKVIYLGWQLFFSPIALLEALSHRGGIMRIVIKKTS